MLREMVDASRSSRGHVISGALERHSTHERVISGAESGSPKPYTVGSRYEWADALPVTSYVKVHRFSNSTLLADPIR